MMMRMQDDYEVEGDLGGGNGIDIVQTANNTEPTEVVGEEMGHRVSAVVPAAGGWRDQRRPVAECDSAKGKMVPSGEELSCSGCSTHRYRDRFCYRCIHRAPRVHVRPKNGIFHVRCRLQRTIRWWVLNLNTKKDLNMKY